MNRPIRYVTEENLNDFLESVGSSPAALSRDSGVSKSTISKIINGSLKFTDMRHSTTLALADVIGYPMRNVTTNELIKRKANEVAEVMVRFIQDDNAAFCKEWTHNLPGKWMEFFKTVHKCGFNLDYAQTDAVASTVSLWALYGQDGNSQLWYQFGRLSHKFGGTKRGKGPMMDADLGDFERMKEVVALVARYGGVRPVEHVAGSAPSFLGAMHLPRLSHIMCEGGSAGERRCFEGHARRVWREGVVAAERVSELD